MSKIFIHLNDDNIILDNFINKWSIDPSTSTDIRDVRLPLGNRHKTSFYLNEYSLEESIKKEVEERFLPVVQNTALSSWHESFSTKLLIYFYRRITSEKYQTSAHMRIVYAIATAEELSTRVTTIMDDEMDGTTEGYSILPWRLRSPTPITPDCLLLLEGANSIMQSCIPQSHPAKEDIIRVFNAFQRHCCQYWCLSSFLATSRASQQQDSREYPLKLELITRDTVMSRTWSRAGQWIWALFNISRLLSCYQNLKTDDIRIMRDQMFRVGVALCLIDDLLDLPDSEKPLEDLTRDDLADILEGDVQNHALLAALELARQSTSDLSNEQRQEIFNVLQQCFGTGDRGDARRVAALYRKYNVADLLKQMFREQLAEYKDVAETDALEFNMPPDIIWHSVTFYLSGEEKKGLATKVQQLYKVKIPSLREKENLIIDLLQNYIKLG
ncbi:hypothetical protein ACMFMG_006207 [Clarireedia jacksonii]